MSSNRDLELIRINQAQNRVMPDVEGRQNTRGAQNEAALVHAVPPHQNPTLLPGNSDLSPVRTPQAQYQANNVVQHPTPGTFVYEDHYAESPHSAGGPPTWNIDSLTQEIMFYCEQYDTLDNWEAKIHAVEEGIRKRLVGLEMQAANSSSRQLVEKLIFLRRHFEAGKVKWSEKLMRPSNEEQSAVILPPTATPVVGGIVPLSGSGSDLPFHGFSSVRDVSDRDSSERVLQDTVTTVSSPAPTVLGFGGIHVPTHNSQNVSTPGVVFTTATNVAVMSQPQSGLTWTAAEIGNNVNSLSHSYLENTQTHKHYSWRRVPKGVGPLQYELVEAETQNESSNAPSHEQDSTVHGNFDSRILLTENGYIANTEEIRKILQPYKPGYLDHHPALWTFILFELVRKLEAQVSTLQINRNTLNEEYTQCKGEHTDLLRRVQDAQNIANTAEQQARYAAAQVLSFPSDLPQRVLTMETDLGDLPRQVAQLAMHQRTLPSEPTSPRVTSSRLDQIAPFPVRNENLFPGSLNHTTVSSPVPPMPTSIVAGGVPKVPIPGSLPAGTAYSSSGNCTPQGISSAMTGGNMVPPIMSSFSQAGGFGALSQHPALPISQTEPAHLVPCGPQQANRTSSGPGPQQHAQLSSQVMQNVSIQRGATSSLLSAQPMSTRVLERTLKLTLQRVQDIIDIEVDKTLSKEKLYELYTTKTKTLEMLISDCSKQISSYCSAPGAVDQEANIAFTVLEEAQEWMRRLRVFADAKEIFSKPIAKEFRKKLQPFSNSPSMNIFDFFRHFEEYVESGSKTKKARILVEEYLITWIRLQVTVYDYDYDRIKAYLIEEFGNIRTITQTLLNSLKGVAKPQGGASLKTIAKYLGTILSGIYDMRNLRSLPEVRERDLLKHISSADFMESLVGLIPDSLKVEFNKKLADEGKTLRNFFGYDAYDSLLEFLERETKSHQIFLKDEVGKQTNSQTEKNPKKSAHATAAVPSSRRRRTSSFSSCSSNSSSTSSSADDSMSILCAVSDGQQKKKQGSSPKQQRSPKGNSSSPKRWYNSKFTMPCPIDKHEHEIGSCNDFLAMKVKDRLETSKRKLCFVCLYPWERCKSEGCRKGSVPSTLICSDCDALGKKVVPNLLFCLDAKHSKPKLAELLKPMRSYIKGFESNKSNPKVKLSSHFFMANFSQGCNQCASIDKCSCQVNTLSSPFDKNQSTPAYNSETGKEIDPKKTKILHEADEASVFCMQWIKIRDKPCLVFYDRGSSQHLVSGPLAEEVGMKVLNPRPSTLTVVGGGSKSTEYGLYQMYLGPTDNGEIFEIQAQGMPKITADFPEFDLSSVNKELRSFKDSHLKDKEKLPKKIGGAPSHLLIGIKTVSLEPELLFTLPSGIGVYRSKIRDMWGSNICYGGPHKTFTQALKRIGGNHMLMTAFVDSYRHSTYPSSLDTIGQRGMSRYFEDSGHGVMVSKVKGIPYSIDSGDEIGCKFYPSSLTQDDFEDSGCSIPSETLENFDQAMLSDVPMQKSPDVSFSVPLQPITCGYSNLISEERRKLEELYLNDPYHKCPVLKAKVPLSRLRQVLDERDADDSLAYRCSECLKCITCKQSGRKKAISLQERFEQEIIDKSIKIDLVNKKVFADMPFLKDPVQFLKEKHRNLSDNRYQALQVYKGQCRKASQEVKEGMRQVQQSLVEKGFMSKLEDLTPDQRQIIEEAEFKHYFPWRLVYKIDSVSTPVRVVVDPTMSGLNLVLAKGENRIGKIATIMIRSRVRRHIWSSDISKLYNQLKLNDTSLPYSLFLYHDSLDPDKDPDIWVLTSVWYGTGSSGNQAEAALERLAATHEGSHPLAMQPMIADRYVDDIQGGSNTQEELEEQIRQTVDVLGQGGLKLKYIVKSGEDPPEEASTDQESLKLLGYTYKPKVDTLSLGFNELNFNPKVRGAKSPNPQPVVTSEDAEVLMKDLVITRRVVVSKVAELFDPVGLFEPIKVQLKLQLKKLNGRDWDKPLTDEEQDLWKSFFTIFPQLHTLNVDRCVIPRSVPSSVKLRLLCIADAAVHCGGAAVYAGCRIDDSSYSCSLLASKSKLLDATIPRNELSAILLMTELANSVKNALGDLVSEIVYVTDSTAAMCWCFNTKKKLRMYVLNRVSLIRQMIQWTTGEEEKFPLYHVDGLLNIADLLTKERDLPLDQVTRDSAWQCGLDWMRLPTEQMPFTKYEDLTVDSALQEEIKEEYFPEPHLQTHDNKIHCIVTKLGSGINDSHCAGCPTVSGKMSEWPCHGLKPDEMHCNNCICTEKPSVSSSFVGKGSQACKPPSTPLVDLIKFGWAPGLRILGRVTGWVWQLVHQIHINPVATDGTRRKPEVVKKFESICKICKEGVNDTPSNNLFDTVFVKEAENHLFRVAADQCLSTMSKRKLSQFHQENGILYFAGRLPELKDLETRDLDINCFFDSQNIKSVLPVVRADSQVFYSLAIHIHLHILPHSGVEMTMKEISKRVYAIDNPRKVIQKIRNDCTFCRRLLKRTVELRMAQHPAPRFVLTPPFYHVMTDIVFGFKGKPYLGARKISKLYALVLVCLLTSATNILVLEGLQTQNVIQAIERHSSRYGMPRVMYIDNGSQLVALQHAGFQLRDVDAHLHDSTGFKLEVTAAKSHESQGRVERRIGLLRQSLAKLSIDTDIPMTSIQWETLFSKISCSLDDIPIAKDKPQSKEDPCWDIITPNRLKMGRNTQRSLEIPSGITLNAGPDKLLEVNRKIQETWYRIFIDRIHNLIPKPNKWHKSDRPEVNDIVLFIQSDSVKGKETKTWKLGRIIGFLKNKSRAEIEYCGTIPGGDRLPEKKTIVRNVRYISVIFSVEDLGINTSKHFESCLPK